MNSQTNEPFLDWKKGKPDPSFVGDRKIIVTALNVEHNNRRDYNVVFYHAPMDVWYGGPGILVKTDDIKSWAEIPAPVDADN
ncbi:hypothetical protein GFM13_33890 [Rhizobium leguminosarum bv. viciae]|nr:hypothetical protein [Rhizobium leguminosarum bv. viciae]